MYQLQRSASLDKIPKDVKPTDIVIIVMGHTGSGMSTFVNQMLDPGVKPMRCTNSLEPSTVEITATVIDMNEKTRKAGLPEGRRLVVVDTPGLEAEATSTVDQTSILLRPENTAIIGRIENWLHKSNTMLCGVVYVHDISEEHTYGKAERILDCLDLFLRSNIFTRAVIATSKWGYGGQPEERCQERVDVLAQSQWSTIIEKGVKVLRFANNSESAWDIIKTIIGSVPLDVAPRAPTPAQRLSSIIRTKVNGAVSSASRRLKQNEEDRVFQLPEYRNVDGLIRSTRDALGRIKVWLGKEVNSCWGQRLQAQMRTYGFAVGLSVSSAQTVFTLAREAQSLIKLMTKQTDPSDVRSFLQGMANHARTGLAMARRVATRFKDVERDVNLLRDDIAISVENETSKTLDENIDVVESFTTSICLLATWWTQIYITMSSHSTNSARLVQTYSGTGGSIIARKWQGLEAALQDYTHKVGLLQDTYPDLIERIDDTSGIDIDRPIQSTIDVLALIAPSYACGGVSTQNRMPSALEEKMCHYGCSIRHSLTSARRVFNLTQDAISLIEHLRKDATQAEIVSTVTQATDLAKLGQDEIKRIVCAFNNVRLPVQTHQGDITTAGQVNGTVVLENCTLEDSLLLYLRWWTRFEQLMAEQHNYCITLLQTPTVTHTRKSIAAWVKHGQSFGGYSEKILIIQESYPEMFERFFTVSEGKQVDYMADAVVAGDADEEP